MSEKDYKPFEPKAKEDRADYIKRKEKWEEKLEEDTSLDHRRFGVTLHVGQVVTAFKKCVRANEIKQSELITCYRVVLQHLLADPDLSDESFLSMYSVIQSRAQVVYSRRSRRLKGIK